MYAFIDKLKINPQDLVADLTFRNLMVRVQPLISQKMNLRNDFGDNLLKAISLQQQKSEKDAKFPGKGASEGGPTSEQTGQT